MANKAIFTDDEAKNQINILMPFIVHPALQIREYAISIISEICKLKTLVFIFSNF